MKSSAFCLRQKQINLK